jgi:hypothetical protein
VVVGGVAATIHGAPYITNDLDICYNTAPDNIQRLVELLKQWDAYPRGWEPGGRARDKEHVIALEALLKLRDQS